MIIIFSSAICKNKEHKEHKEYHIVHENPIYEIINASRIGTKNIVLKSL